jgi:hypothetical protein
LLQSGQLTTGPFFMPYTLKQHKLFEAAAHNPAVAKAKGMSTATAKRLAKEGVKRKPVRKVLE